MVFAPTDKNPFRSSSSCKWAPIYAPLVQKQLLPAFTFTTYGHYYHLVVDSFDPKKSILTHMFQRVCTDGTVWSLYLTRLAIASTHVLEQLCIIFAEVLYWQLHSFFSSAFAASCRALPPCRWPRIQVETLFQDSPYFCTRTYQFSSPACIILQ